MALLLREALGESLRRARVSQSRTLREVSSVARVSLGYLSEVERGRKEASSELLASICDALEVELADLMFDVSETLAESKSLTSGAGGASVGALGGSGIADTARMVIPAPSGAHEGARAKALAAA
jgi:transcriptional regulator with XRE-family HTH domain